MTSWIKIFTKSVKSVYAQINSQALIERANIKSLVVLLILIRPEWNDESDYEEIIDTALQCFMSIG